MNPSSRADWEVISVYTRRQALADGLLLDATPQAREAGFCRSLAVTATFMVDIPSSNELVSILFQFHSLIIAGHGSEKPSPATRCFRGPGMASRRSRR